ncbi:MAG: DNA replication/repair protein RecF [Clostridia bacterium]|nr:DNA replication/repair protein RecF [Clostridia bacterium]
MIVSKYRAKHFRNIKDLELFPDAGVNVIFGDNGQGKTNILESIWMFTGCHSFRTHKTVELIEKTQREAKVSLSFSAHGMENDAVLKIDQKREFMMNGAVKESPRRFLGEFQSVIFSPDSLSIVQDAPAERRRFLDIAVSMIRPAYSTHLLKYTKILANRNALLKQISLGGAEENYLDVWDEELAREGAHLTVYRLHYTESLARIASEIYKEISGGRESLYIEYQQSSRSVSAEEYELAESIFMGLQKNREADIRRQITSVGPHKDDLYISVDRLAARQFASQGQQRSGALALKLAEGYIIKETCGEYPVILLDDVMSELDGRRQSFLLEYLKNWQVFLTCCDASQVSRFKGCKTFHIEQGACIGE